MFTKLIQSKKIKLGMPITMAILSGIVVSGCQIVDTKDNTANKNNEIMMCTMEYDPFCATVEINGKKMQKQFGNSCSLGNYNEGKIISSKRGECQ